MARQIYRQAALDRLASPEDLDRPHRLTAARGWVAVCALLAILVGGVGWALISDAPVKVPAQGIVLREGGLSEVVAGVSGRVSAVDVRVGQTVAPGESIARFHRVELEREIRTKSAELAAARDRRQRLTTFYDEQDARERAAEDERLASIQASQALAARREATLAQQIADLQRLQDQRVVTNLRVIDAELQLSTAQERVAQLDDEAKVLQLKRLERRSRYELALLDEQLKVDALERDVKRLKDRLADERRVVSAAPGRVVEIKVSPGDVVSAGAAIVTVEPVSSDAEATIALLYVTPTVGKRVAVGMPAEVTPTAFQRAQYGYIRGEVEFVSSAPATAEGMRRVLRNEQLVAQLAGGAAPFEVRVRFETDPNTPSGLAWSSSTGPPGPVAASALLEAQILVERLPIANLVFPGLDATLGLSSVSEGQQ